MIDEQYKALSVKEAVMGHFASDNPPDLFNEIQVRGIWRKIYEHNLIDNILINSVEILLKISRLAFRCHGALSMTM